MDIFVIKIVDADNVHMDLLKEFQKKEIKDEIKWNEHCFSYLMVDRILREFYKISDREVIFSKDKPYLKNNQKFFNISRSNEYVAIAFSDKECSISLEEVEDKNNKEHYSNLTRNNAIYKLNKKSEKTKSYCFENYILTVASENNLEDFDIYMQSGEVFPN